MKFLICSDGSEHAERAVRLGAAIAAGCKAEITLFGIVEGPPDSKPLLEALHRSRAFLEEKKIPCELVTKSGEPISEIVKRTQESNPDLVIIGAARKQTAGTFWMSSKVYKIIKEITPPVLAVVGKTSSLNRILVCTGGKSYIDKAINLTGQIARGLGASVTLLHIMPDLPAIYAPLPGMEQTSAAILASNSELGINLRREKETLEAFGVPTEVRLRHGSVLNEILQEMRLETYGFVVTGSALSRGLTTYVLGDVSREILNRAHRAVLVVRSEQTPSHSLLNFKGWLRRRAAPSNG